MQAQHPRRHPDPIRSTRPLGRLALLAFLALASLVLAACGGDADSALDGDVDDDRTEDPQTDGDNDTPDGDNDASDDDGEEAPIDYTFNEFDWMDTPPDVAQRICEETAAPENLEDPVNIHCTIEGEHFAPDNVAAKNEIVVMAYNIERGYHVDEQIAAIRDDPAIPVPDVILISEADRGCSRTDSRYVIREYAQALEMNYVYAVEFVELPRQAGSGGQISGACEHGNGILSRYPIGNVHPIRHTTQRIWYEDEGEPRLGGRIAVRADIQVGERILHVYAVHFESDIGELIRAAQAEELIADAAALPFTSVVGGDLNSGYYVVDLTYETDSDQTIRPFLEADWVDAHAALPTEQRVTAPHSGFILDILLADDNVFSQPGIGPEDLCGDLSDHLPVWASVALP